MLTGEQILKARERKGYSQYRLAELSGIPRTRIAAWEQGKANPKAEDVDNLRNILGHIDKNLSDSSRVSEPSSQYGTKLQGIPVYDVEFSAGFIEQIRDSKVEILTYINIPEVQGCDCVIRAKGDSMADYINNMDWIGIRRIQDTQVVAYGQPYAIVTKDLQLIKYIRKGSPGNYLLKSENENFDDFELPIAKVLELYIIKTILKIKPLI